MTKQYFKHYFKYHGYLILIKDFNLSLEDIITLKSEINCLLIITLLFL